MKRRHFIGAAAATGIAIRGRADAQSTTNLRNGVSRDLAEARRLLAR